MNLLKMYCLVNYKIRLEDESVNKCIDTMCESIRAFKSIGLRHSELLSEQMTKILELHAIESAKTHHHLLSLRYKFDKQPIEQMAHEMCEFLTTELLTQYDSSLSLEQNLELWTIKNQT